MYSDERNVGANRHWTIELFRIRYYTLAAINITMIAPNYVIGYIDYVSVQKNKSRFFQVYPKARSKGHD